MIFKNNKVYDILKYLALILLNAVGNAYEELSGVWNLPYGTQIMKTCSILSILIGTLIGISSAKYNKQLDHTEYEDAGEDLDIEVDEEEINE